MTGQSSLVLHMQPYASPFVVYLGNGDTLIITHTGNIPLSLGSSNFLPALHNIARFTQGNLVFFAPHFY